MSAGGAHGRARRGGGHDEGGHDGPDERWLVSYADMITVLMALFIVLFAISQVDAQKFLQLKQGLAEGVGANSVIPVDGGSGLLVSNGSIAAPAQPQTAVQAESATATDAGAGAATPSAERAASAMEAAREEVERLDELQRRLDAALQSGGLGDRVDFRITERGLVGAIVADDVFFESSSAALRETGREVVDAMAPVLDADTHPLELQGHTNSLPVRGGLYPSNWELSAARAAAVVRHLETDGIASDRMTAVGYGETQPLYPGDDEEALSGNRRVDLVVISDQPAEVKALLPEAAAEAGAAPPAPAVAPDPVAVAPVVQASAAELSDAGGR